MVAMMMSPFLEAIIGREDSTKYKLHALGYCLRHNRLALWHFIDTGQATTLVTCVFSAIDRPCRQ